jgi:hypothetical protein
MGILCPTTRADTDDVTIRQESAVSRRPDLPNIAFLDQSCVIKPTVEVLGQRMIGR